MTNLKAMTSCVVSGMLLWLSSPGAAVIAPAFSADVVITRVGNKPSRRVGHVFVSGGKVRIETPEFADGFFIVDADANGAWFVRPRQRLFMEAKQSSPLTQWLVRVDPGDPCRQWRLMATVAGVINGGGDWQCELLTTNAVEGRDTLKYSATSPQGHRSERWIDPQRLFPVRVETEDGTTMTVENVVDAPQPATLFAIPTDYQKFDPAQLIEIVKRSDVWVEPPR